MKKFILTSCIIIGSFSAIFSQTFIYYGNRTFGGSQFDGLCNFQKTSDNHVIIVGSSQNDVNGDKTEARCDSLAFGGIGRDNWLLKIDTGLNIIWDRDIGRTESGGAFPILATSEINDLIVFSSIANGDSACEKSENSRDSVTTSAIGDYWICALDSNGIKVWDKTLGGNKTEGSPLVSRLSAGNYIVCGSSQSDSATGDKTVANYGGATDYWAIKLDSVGHILWNKVYGGSANEYANPIFSGLNFSLLSTHNDGFILAGTTTSPANGTISDTSLGGKDIWIAALDSSGNKIWDKRFGGDKADVINCIKHTSDGGYIVCGTTQSNQSLFISELPKGSADAWVLKLDSNGNKQWDRRFGGTSKAFTFPDGKTTRGISIEEAPGGGYWVCASTNCDDTLDISEPAFGTSTNVTLKFDYWIFKIDSVGNKIFDKRFGGPGTDFPSNLIIMPDSSVFVIGMADYGNSAVKTDAGKGMTDYWIVHFKYIDSVTVGINNYQYQNLELMLQPNPANDILEINIKTEQLNQLYSLSIFDISGRPLLKQAFNGKANLDVTNLAPGLYIVAISDKQNRRIQKKFVKL